METHHQTGGLLVRMELRGVWWLPVVVLMMVGKDGKQQIKTAQHEKVQLIDDNEEHVSKRGRRG